jgi:ribosomal protein L25 (general stress protein Ctc)
MDCTSKELAIYSWLYQGKKEPFIPDCTKERRSHLFLTVLRKEGAIYSWLYQGKKEPFIPDCTKERRSHLFLTVPRKEGAIYSWLYQGKKEPFIPDCTKERRSHLLLTACYQNMIICLSVDTAAQLCIKYTSRAPVSPPPPHPHPTNWNITAVLSRADQQLKYSHMYIIEREMNISTVWNKIFFKIYILAKKYYFLNFIKQCSFHCEIEILLWNTKCINIWYSPEAWHINIY